MRFPFLGFYRGFCCGAIVLLNAYEDSFLMTSNVSLSLSSASQAGYTLHGRVIRPAEVGVTVPANEEA